MKKLIFLLLAIALMAPTYASGADKTIKKAVSSKLKEYKQGNWEVLGSYTLEMALTKHYERMEKMGDDVQEYIGISTATKSKNTGKQMALNAAMTEYANMAGTELQGKVASDMNASGTDPDTEFENFYAAYKRNVQAEIKGEMQHSFSIMRPNGDGTYEVRSFFLVSENAAAKARQRALDKAMQDSEAAQKHADKITKFVEEGFEN